jgi:hypothetical protein
VNRLFKKWFGEELNNISGQGTSGNNSGIERGQN